MSEPEVTLGGFLRRVSEGSERSLCGHDACVSLREAAEQTGFAPGEDFHGRSILIATPDQLTTTLVLLELDGVARRLTICPPGVAERDLADIVEQAEIDTIIGGEDMSAIADLGVAKMVRYAGLSRPRQTPTEPACASEWVLTTSGTTGAPKLVAHTIKGLVGAIPAAAPASTGGEPIVWATFYDIRRYGGLQMLLRAIVGGSSMVLSHATEPLDEHLRRLAKHGATHISGTPSHWRRVLMSPESALLSPKYVRLSGEIADQALLDALKEKFRPSPVSHAYASTEAGVGFDVTDGLEGFPESLVSRSAGARVEMKVIDGSLRIRSERTARKYLGSAAPLCDAEGFVDTGDMIERRGDRYYFVGRRGGIINVGGLKVHPEEVEAVINRQAGVRMSRVSARRSPITGALVQAEIVLDGDHLGTDEAVIKDAILALCRTSLAPHKIPSRINVVERLTVTDGGKLARPHG